MIQDLLPPLDLLGLLLVLLRWLLLLLLLLLGYGEGRQSPVGHWWSWERRLRNSSMLWLQRHAFGWGWLS